MSRHDRPVRIFVNATSARIGGGQTYLVNLLAQLPSPEQATVYLLTDRSLTLDSSAPNLIRLPTPHGLDNPVVRLCWEHWRLPRLLREIDADVLFCPGGLISGAIPTTCRTVTMFRNMLPFDDLQLRRHPLVWLRLRAWLLRRALARSMQKADLVIFVSDWAGARIRELLGATLARSVTIHHGINGSFRLASGGGQRRPAWLPPGPYLLYVSVLEFYKSQVEVVRGYALFRERTGIDAPLLLAGDRSSAYARQVEREIERLGLERHVLLPGNVPYAELAPLYHGAAAVIFASECENCPNILLEALAAGRPVLSSNLPPMPEFGRDAVLYFDPRQPEQLAQQLGELFANAQLAADLGRRAAERSRDFDWNASRARTWEALIDLGRCAEPAATARACG